MMKRIGTKSQLAIALSKLDGFKDPKLRQEQYITDSEIAASVLWSAHLFKDIEGKVIADLGCGTGVLGIGALLLGAKMVLFIDSDKEALAIAKKNVLKLKSESLLYTATFEMIEQDISKTPVEKREQFNVP